jgi:hypothetical protein
MNERVESDAGAETADHTLVSFRLVGDSSVHQT